MFCSVLCLVGRVWFGFDGLRVVPCSFCSFICWVCGGVYCCGFIDLFGLIWLVGVSAFYVCCQLWCGCLRFALALFLG